VVYGEKKRLVQVIENLLSNAIKYIGKDNPVPQIEIGHKKNGVQDVFFVKDNGIGIQQRYQKIIFQVFQRLPDAKKAGEGTGIGLAIVERVIKHHEGEIWVSSEPGKGSTFFFTLNKSEV
ncbi:MAG: GHKL domain-containing protein, partial [Desulfobacterium sp.]|nr:GHKL domain-containing protein [Desulfobacterium sp.]